MDFFKHAHHSLRRHLALLLVACLLLVQSLGLLHDLLHAGGGSLVLLHGRTATPGVELPEPNLPASSLENLFGVDGAVNTSDSTGSVDSGHARHHSCINFEAATVAAMLHTAVFALAIMENRHCLAIRSAFSSWQAPFHPNFSSRAPPLN